MSIVLRIEAVHQYGELAHEAQHRNELFKQYIKSHCRLYENENSAISEVNDSQLQRQGAYEHRLKNRRSASIR